MFKNKQWFVSDIRPVPSAEVSPVPDTEISFHVPPECIRCRAIHTLELQQTTKGGEIVLEWCCTICNAEWPVKRRDEQPRV